jgi:outer membrane immunogenic protein
MKRLPLALIAVTALSGSALAADLPARIYTKAQPQVAVAPSWTGFYVFGGGGGACGMLIAMRRSTIPPPTPVISV